ncbi:hypothetical protein KDA23_04485 [Candidatus Saccharibacteria bacterium]|nr:hypothetical protein [Candidatus Saccharibacteria bacterium]
MTNLFKSHPKLSWIVVSLLAIGGVVATLEATDTTYWLHDKPQTYTASEYTKGATDSPGTSETSEGTKTSTGSSATLIKPTGNFVSSHHVTNSSNIASTCNSTPGATCQITFTKGGVTKKLPSRIVDNGGAAYWSWQTSDIGLTQGDWKVRAVATLGSQQSTATDALVLEVQ